MSATKRRVDHAEMMTPAPKRKRNDDTHFPDRENSDTTSEIGLKLVKLLKKSQDKTGRNVAVHFMDLPSKSMYPDYYESTAMPISLNMVEKRLEDGQYRNMTDLESDLKRMVQNAKDYNASKSEVFEDAERIRKALSNFMPKHNPAYLNPEYRAQPTPIPQNLLDRVRDSSVSTQQTTGPERVKLVFSNSAAKRRQSLTTSAAAEEEEEDENDSLKEKQLSLLQELSDEENAINFEEKPSRRDYSHYYKIIERPTSISDVRSMVERGKIKDWNSFAKEVRLIWDNAKEYNEPGSEIYGMAESLELWFEKKVQEEGAQPRVLTRLSLSQPRPKHLKLTMGSANSTPTVQGGTIDNESLRRQKEEMGQALSRAQATNSRGVSMTTTEPRRQGSASESGSAASRSEPRDLPMTGMNGSSVSRPSAVPSETIRVAAPPPNTKLPTPAMDGELVPAQSANPTVNGNHSHLNHNRSIYADSDNPIERKYRDTGKGLEDALLASVTYMTHPNLPNDPKWKITRYASATRTQTSSYIYLPPDHFFLRVMPNLTAELRSRRNYKVCVALNWQVIAQSQHVPGSYEFRLQPGENVVTVDVIAELRNGEYKTYAPPQLQLDFERITFIIVLVDRNVD